MVPSQFPGGISAEQQGVIERICLQTARRWEFYSFMEKRKQRKNTWPVIRQRLYRMVAVGVVDEPLNRFYDILNLVTLILNIVVTLLQTYPKLMTVCGPELKICEQVTVAFFAVDYGLRMLTARCATPQRSEGKSLLKYSFSAAGIIDLLSWLPYYLPIFFPYGAAVFRMFRIIRIFKLFRINAYYDSLNVITEVLYSKKQQLLSSVFIIFVMMIASSLCMYSLEHNAQPEVFDNAFSGIWWAASTLLTVGYGDIYPVTTAGQIVGIIITFLGVGMVAIPTGIISAGFVEQYSRLKRIGDYAVEEDIHFIKIELNRTDSWVDTKIMDLHLPHGAIIAAVQRGQETIIPRGDVVLKAGDRIIIGAESMKNDQPANLKEVVLRRDHPWNGQKIQDLDISRQTFLVMIQRQNTTLIPKGDTVLHEGDVIILYSKSARKADEQAINI